MYGHVIAKFSGMGRFTYPWCSAGALRAPELRYDQDPSGFCFLVQIRAFVIETSLGLANLHMKGKTKRILVVVVK